MVIDIDDKFPDDMGESGSDETTTDDSRQGSTLADKQIKEQAQKNLLARKRIDELMEKKRLKSLLDDSDDW